MRQLRRFVWVVCVIGFMVSGVTVTAAGFADANLEQAVRAALHQPTGVLQADALAGIKQLDASGRNIRSIAGIESLVGLEELRLSQNYVNDLTPLAGLTNLRRLYLDRNKLVDIEPLRGLVELEILHLNQNNVEDLAPLSGLPWLHTLRLDFTRVTDISVLDSMLYLRDLNLRRTPYLVKNPGSPGREVIDHLMARRGMRLDVETLPTVSGPGEVLYNGIVLPQEWPPRSMQSASTEPMPVPYLESPPAVIPIDVGRQLFVDDFLIEATDLERTFYSARLYEGNPVLKPQTPLEMGVGSSLARPRAVPFNDGFFYDPEENVFKAWYRAGELDVAYAVSQDGIHWERPRLMIKPDMLCLPTNAILPVPQDYTRDGVSVWLDQNASNPNERYKMFAYFRTSGPYQSLIYTSADGLHWDQRARTSPVGDNTSFFYNPFRDVWVWSIRSYLRLDKSYDIDADSRLRHRSYREHPDFVQSARWTEDDEVFWVRADGLDVKYMEYPDHPQLYNLNAVAYESLMLGMFAIFQGPPNEIARGEGIVKSVDLMVGFSRDGFHWDRPYREPFIPQSGETGTWNRGYLHSAGGVALVVGEELWFYFAAFSGETFSGAAHHHSGGSTGLAILRRDGFASMGAWERTGTLTTRPITFAGGHLFVNADIQGELRVEVLDGDGHVIEPFGLANAVPVTGDGTLMAVEWAGADLADLAGEVVQLRFHLTDGELYAFWVSPDPSGASYGYVAAGGPGYTGPVDTVGVEALRAVEVR